MPVITVFPAIPPVEIVPVNVAFPEEFIVRTGPVLPCPFSLTPNFNPYP